MKHLSLTLLAVIAFTTSNAQQNQLAFLKQDRIMMTPKLDREVSRFTKTYFESVAANHNSKIVRELQLEISNFNLKTSNIYDATEKASYHIRFKKRHCKASVTFSGDGKILSSKETYKNIKVPYQLRAKILKAYPGWSFKKNSYTITYALREDMKEVYSIHISKGNLEKKTLRYDGNFRPIH